MSVILTLHEPHEPPYDPNRWWLNPNIWVVPGDSPYGPKGEPVANEKNWIWCRPQNKGTEKAETEVLYWAWPNTAHVTTWGQIEEYKLPFTTQTEIHPGNPIEILAHHHWTPQPPSGAVKMCILVVVTSSQDSMLMPPDETVNAEDRHVAQLNISIKPLADDETSYRHPLWVPPTDLTGVTVTVRRERMANVAALQVVSGLDVLPEEMGEDMWKASFQTAGQIKSGRTLGASPELGKARGLGSEFYLLLQTEKQRRRTKGKNKAASGALFAVESWRDGRLLNGLHLLLLAR